MNIIDVHTFVVTNPLPHFGGLYFILALKHEVAPDVPLT